MTWLVGIVALGLLAVVVGLTAGVLAERRIRQQVFRETYPDTEYWRRRFREEYPMEPWPHERTRP